ncbi:MAG: tRNA lysidine(34) synthetase TilS [Candidatus Omnitrophica bacterium]|nr:tRNA lysidine(34) synthetase TilS [Candidatus Omnitrophota bacterium]
MKKATLEKNDSLARRFGEAVERGKLIPPASALVVAVSGGVDSVALLHLLAGLRRQRQWKLCIAHLNHGLRGKESGRDEALVRKLAAGLHCECVIERVHTRNYARREKVSVEEAARILRYEFLTRTAVARRIELIATAHTFDDQAETVLMRIIRGTGLSGLSAMRLRRKHGAVEIVRPLLLFTKQELIGWARARGISWREDSSNTQRIFFRNRIRWEVLPLLETMNPRVRQALVRLAEQAREWSAVQQRLIKSVIASKGLRRADGSLQISLSVLRRMPAALRTEVVRILLARAGARMRRISAVHIRQIDALIAGASGSRAVIDLPEGAQVCRQASAVVFTRPGKRAEKLPLPELRLPFGSSVRSTAWGYVFSCRQAPKPASFKKIEGVEYADADSLVFPLCVRARRPGDIFHPLGARGKKKLKDFFISEKIPQPQRSLIPLIVSGGEIVIAGRLRLSERCKVTESTVRVVRIAMRPIVC